MTNKQKQQIKKMAKKMNLRYLYLFGSQARGTAGALSDFDFAVKFSPKIKDKFKARLGLLAEFNKILKSDKVDVVDIEEVDPIMAFNIVSEGKVLYSACEDERISERVKITLFYLDKKYYYDRHFKETIKQVAAEKI